MNDARGDVLRITVTDTGETRLLRLTGEFDLAGVELFESRLEAAGTRAPQVLVVDVRELTFIDTSGVRALVTADLRLASQGGRLIVVKRPGPVDRVLKLMGLSDRLELVDEIPRELGLGGGP